MTKYFKLLTADGKSPFVTTTEWKLPTETEPGGWMRPVKGHLEACFNGYHVCSAEHFMLFWQNYPEKTERESIIYLAEIGGKFFTSEYDIRAGLMLDPKTVARTVRLVERVMTWGELQRILSRETERYTEILECIRDHYIGMVTGKRDSYYGYDDPHAAHGRETARHCLLRANRDLMIEHQQAERHYANLVAEVLNEY